MYYYLNPKSHVMLLQVLLMVLLIIIISMIYYQSTLTDQLNEDILALDIDCPDVNCPENKDCPDCVCSDNKTPCPGKPENVSTDAIKFLSGMYSEQPCFDRAHLGLMNLLTQIGASINTDYLRFMPEKKA